ncbi:MAG: leucine-rich repeat protein [Acetobacterium woodii]|nr:leucine-rich repeat protein [Acetobacterium woodii]
MTKKRFLEKLISNKLIFWLACCTLLGLFLPMSASAAANPVGVAYRGHIQDLGDYPADGSWVDSPKIIGTEGQSKRIEGFEIKLTGAIPTDLQNGLELRYNVHVQNKGWLYDENDSANWPKDGDYAGTRGESLRIEAVKIVLTDADGKAVSGYSVQYRGHVQNVGNLPTDESQWLADGDQLGTVGSSLRLEALLVKVVPKETDLAAYTALVTQIEKLKAGDFTAQSWGRLQTALKEHLVTADQSQTAVDAAVKAIQLAYDGLDKKAAPTVYDKAGTFGPATGTQTIAGDVTVNADGVILQNLKIEGDLTIAEAVGNGTVTLNNVTVVGDTFVRGGGKNSIHINGGQYSRIVMEKTASGAVRIVATGVDGLDVVISEDAAGETIILEGVFDSVEVNAPNMTVTTQGSTTIGTMTVGAGAGGTTLNLAAGTTVADLALNAKTAIKGQGTVTRATINADSVVFEKAPGSYTVKSGVVIPPVFPTPDNGGGGGYTPPVAVTGVTLDQTITVGVNKTAQLNATVQPSNAADKTVIWTSSDDTIATVDATGKVTGKKEGPVTISVKTTDGNKTANCSVTVTTSFEVTKIADGSGIITGMNGSSTVIAIPETIDGVTISAIGDQAFYNRNITSVEIPKTVKTIGNQAFYNCLNLTTVTFAADSSLTSIGTAAFASIGVSSLTLPANLKTIGGQVFFGCSLLKTITISDGVTAVPVEAFANCHSLTVVTLPSGLTAIGIGAFSNCSQLTEITIPKGVNTLGSGAFGYAVDNAPTSRHYTFLGDVPGTMGTGAIPITAPKPTIKYYANYDGYDGWADCTREIILTTPVLAVPTIVNISAPLVNLSWNSISGAAAYDVFVKESAGAYGAAKVSVASGVTSATISGLDSSKSYYFVVKARDAYGESLPSNEQFADLNIAVTGLTVTPASATLIVGNSTALTATVVPANAANKGVTWSSSSDAVATVSNTGMVKAIAAGAATITAAAADGHGAITTCAVTVKPVFESTNTGVATITKYNGNDPNVVIPDKIGEVTVTEIGTGAFSGKTSLKTVTIPDTVTSIGANAFYQSGLTGVAIPEAVTSIGADAFYECLSLTTVTFTGTPNLVTIGDRAFRGCKLNSVVIPNKVTSIGNDAFMQSKLTSLTFAADSQLQTIGVTAFYECPGLETVTIPNSVTSINSAAFKQCKNLKNVNFATTSQVNAIASEAFAVSGLTSIELPDSVTSLGSNTFINCADLSAVTFTANSQLTKLSWYNFSGCGKLSSVTLPPGLTEIGKNVFFNCTALESVTIPASVNTIDTMAFNGEAGKLPASRTITFLGNAPTYITGDAIPMTSGAVATTIKRTAVSTGFDGPLWSSYTVEVN